LATRPAASLTNVVNCPEGEARWRNGVHTTTLVLCHYRAHAYSVHARTASIVCPYEPGRGSQKGHGNVSFLYPSDTHSVAWYIIKDSALAYHSHDRGLLPGAKRWRNGAQTSFLGSLPLPRPRLFRRCSLWSSLLTNQTGGANSKKSTFCINLQDADFFYILYSI